MSKRVKVAVEIDSTFVRMLNATVSLGQLRDRAQLTAVQALAIAVLAEARGGLEDEVDAEIPAEWRTHLRVLHDERRVSETFEVWTDA